MYQKRPRDSQRSKMYRAERSTKKLPHTHFKDLRQIRSYVKRIQKHKWFQERWNWARWIEVRKIRSDASAHGWFAGGGHLVIQIPKAKWAMCEAVVLHEIAHGLAEIQWRKSPAHKKTAWHGPEFAKIYADLVQHYIGVEAGRELKKQYRANGVKYRSNGHA